MTALSKILNADIALGGAQVAMVKPGDASMASPFTAKQGHIMPCTDILKQGRSTLVTTVQMFKILGLLCLSTAYSLSVMYLQVGISCCLPLDSLLCMLSCCCQTLPLVLDWRALSAHCSIPLSHVPPGGYKMC